MKKLTISLFALISLYTISGFFILPLALEYFFQKLSPDYLNHQASLSSIQFNPFELSLTVNDFQLIDTNQEKLIEFEKLYVNLQVSSLFKWSLVLKEVSLNSPGFHVILYKNGKTNFSNLLKPEQPKESKPTSSVFPLIIHNLTLADGNLHFIDKSKAKSFETSLIPINLSLKDLITFEDKKTTHSLSAKTKLGEQLEWNGFFTFSPFVANGNLKFTKIKPKTITQFFEQDLNFKITDGSLSLSGNYSISRPKDLIKWIFSELMLTANKITVIDKLSDAPLLQVPKLEILNAVIDLTNKTLKLPSIKTSSGTISTWTKKESGFNYSNLFRSNSPNSKSSLSKEKSEAPKRENKDWLIEINQLEFSKYSFTFKDLTSEAPNLLELHNIKLLIKDYSNLEGKSCLLDLSLSLNPESNLKLSGNISPKPFNLDLSINAQELALININQYLPPGAQFKITNGSGDIDGKITSKNSSETKSQLKFAGDLSIKEFSSLDSKNQGELFSWKRLDLKQTTLDFSPTTITVEALALSTPSLKIIRNRKGQVNISHLVVSETPAETTPTEGESLSLNLKNISISNGELSFQDQTVSPAFTGTLKSISGTLSELSNTEGQASIVNLSAKINNAPLSLSGRIYPLLVEKNSDAVLSLKNYGMTPLSSYTKEYLGYPIKKGNLSLESEIKVLNRNLTGKNHLVINKIKLGSAVQGKKTSIYPLATGLALLEDSNGRIDLNLPVQGNLDDPNFSYQDLVFTALGNLMLSAVSSPLSLLSSLYPHIEELSEVEFSSSSAELDQSTLEKLDSLSKILADRPGITLSIQGSASAGVDKTNEIDTLDALANQRAQAISDYLENTKEISHERIFVTEPELISSIDPAQINQKVQVRLSISGGVFD